MHGSSVDAGLGVVARGVSKTYSPTLTFSLSVASAAVIFFAIALARGLGFTVAITSGLILTLVANVPEGLPTTVVTVLTLTAQRMSEHRILIKRTDIIETLGAATVICTDKTGTLTQGVVSTQGGCVARVFVWLGGEGEEGSGEWRETWVFGTSRMVQL